MFCLVNAAWSDADFSPDSDQNTFSLRKSYYGLLWYFSRKQWFEVKSVLMLDLFQLLSSPDVNWWTGVVCIIVMFYQLFGLSFWRHPFTAEHPLLRHWCSDTFLQTWWRNKLILILDGLRMRTFSAINYSFNIFWELFALIYNKPCNT